MTRAALRVVRIGILAVMCLGGFPHHSLALPQAPPPEVSASSVSRRLTGPVESWDNLRQLMVGQQIEIVRTDSISVVGTFIGVSDTGIAIRTRQLTVTHPRHLVRRVHVLEGGREGGKGALGLAAGAALGFAVGMAIDCGRVTEHCSGLVALLLGAPIGAVAGGLVGMAAGRYPLVYRAPARAGPGPIAAAPETAPVEPALPPEPPAVVPVDMWRNVRGLTTRDRVEVRLSDGQKLTGWVAGVSDTDLSVVGPDPAGSGPGQLLERGRIVRVHTLTPKKRAKPIVIMTIIGAAAAAPVDLLLDEMFVSPPISPPVTVLSFAAVGVLLGLGDKRALVYDREFQRVHVSFLPILGPRRQELRLTVHF